MTPDIVVDIGNSRMKWGRVAGGAVAEMVSLSLTDEREWEGQLAKWRLALPLKKWAMAGVNPPATERFESWVGNKGLRISNYGQIPIAVEVEEPEKVGIDRLLNAYAAMSHEATLVVSVGTAVTIDLIDGRGLFHGGAILPGFRVMLKSLSQQTSKLPEIDIFEPASPVPGKTTIEAIRTGVFWAILSAITSLRASYQDSPALLGSGSRLLPVVLTGGDSWLLFDNIEPPFQHIPALTLEGIRLAAERVS